ncbi:MAG: hypothetical protein U1G05_02320 [Kiritimatiellia bacterium]
MDPLAQVARHGGKRKIAKETAWAFASKGAALAGTYGLLFFLVHRLDVAEFGRWSYFFSVLLILTQASELGLNTAAKRWFAEARDPRSLGAWIHAAWRLRGAGERGRGAAHPGPGPPRRALDRQTLAGRLAAHGRAVGRAVRDRRILQVPSRRSTGCA